MKYEAIKYGLLFVEATLSQMIFLENLVKNLKQVHISVLWAYLNETLRRRYYILVFLFLKISIIIITLSISA